MPKRIRIVATIILLLCVRPAWGIDDSTSIIDVFLKKCVHGLHQQPNGPFSVFVFCDGAQGTNLGVILTELGAGPGSIELPGPKDFSTWPETNRFWQEPKWAADVVNFFWSPTKTFLFVATSGIYGDGGLFKLDLLERRYVRLFPRIDDSFLEKTDEESYYSKILSIDREKNEIIVGVFLHDEAATLIEKKSLSFK